MYSPNGLLTTEHCVASNEEYDVRSFGRLSCTCHAVSAENWPILEALDHARFVKAKDIAWNYHEMHAEV